MQVVSYPDGCKDLNDVLKKFGQDGVKSVIRKSNWYKVDGVFRFSDLPPIETNQSMNLIWDRLMTTTNLEEVTSV